MEYLLDHPWQLGLVLLIVLALVLEVGRSVAVHFHMDQAPYRKEQMGTIRDGLWLLVSFLLGFALTLAEYRFVDRRSLLVEEAVSIGTTYLRSDTLPLPYRDHSKQLLREYVDSRIELNDAAGDAVDFSQALQHSKGLQEELWSDATAVAQNDRTAVVVAYINSLNEMIDLHDKRVAAFENRIPQTIWFLLIFVSLIAVFTRGSTLTSRFWLSLILVPLTIAIALALIADLDAPSHGLIRQDQRVIQRLQAEMKSEHTN